MVPFTFQAEEGQMTVYPLKISISVKQARIMYFDTESAQEKWVAVLKDVVGSKNFSDYYELKAKLGKG